MRKAPIHFKAVLAAMDMPVSAHGSFVPQLGLLIGLLSALRGIPYVGVIADPEPCRSSSEYHKWHALAENFPLFLMLHGARCMIAISDRLECIVKDEECKRCKATGVCHCCGGSGKGRPGEWNQWAECSCRGSGKCDLCHGTARYIVKETRKDWSKILRTLTA